MADRIILYVGTYTAPASGHGIYVYELNPTTGQINYLSETSVENPSYIAIEASKQYLYSVSEIDDKDKGQLIAYSIAQDTAALTFINSQPTFGSSSCYVCVDHSNRYVMVANYGNGKSAAIYQRRADSGIEAASHTVEHQGSGPVSTRQERPHAHSILADPTNQYVFVADLGIDKLMSYRLNLDDGQLIANDPASVSLVAGSGPRHFVFHPNGKYAYVIQELNSTISVLRYDSSQGAMEVLQTVPALPDGYALESSCAAIHLSADGKFLYGSNRGHDSIVIYAVDEATGKLTYVDHQSTMGQTPRDFVIDPSGTFLLAANQNSDTVVTFRINRETGKLEETGQIADIPSPVCLKMIIL
jgi:6-phosphogluconolactonase